MVAGAVVGLEDVAGTFQGLGLFMATVLVGLSVHMLIQIAIYTIASDILSEFFLSFPLV